VKNIYLILSLFLLSVGLSAQEFEVTPVNPTYYFTLNPAMDQDFANHATITNNTNQVLSLHWFRQVDYIPSGWESAICDRVCYFTSVGSKSLTLQPNEALDFDVHTYTRMNPGDSAMITMKVIEIGTTDTLEAVYRFLGASGTSQQEISDISVYPNPTTDYFQINREENIGEIHLYNIVGRKVKIYDGRENNVFDVSDLRSGVYLVRIFGTNKRVIKTVRLNKR
jgi:hypothetical protein